MATVRNLNGSAPAREKQLITPADVGAVPAVLTGRDQMESAADANRGLVVPGDDMFADMPRLPSNTGLAVAQELGGSGTPYVARAHPNAKNWGSLQAAEVREGDLYVAFEGQYVRAMPLRYWLVDYTVFKSLHNDQGQPIWATTDLNADTSPLGKKPEEHILAVIIADTGERLVPAQADFRGTLSGAVNNLVKLFEAAKSPKFAQGGEAARIAAQFPHPWGRVVGTALTNRRIAGSGRPYYAGSCSARPATLTEMEKLAASLSDPQFLALASEAKESYRQRFETLLNLAQKK